MCRNLIASGAYSRHHSAGVIFRHYGWVLYWCKYVGVVYFGFLLLLKNPFWIRPFNCAFMAAGRKDCLFFNDIGNAFFMVGP